MDEQNNQNQVDLSRFFEAPSEQNTGQSPFDPGKNLTAVEKIRQKINSLKKSRYAVLGIAFLVLIIVALCVYFIFQTASQSAKIAAPAGSKIIYPPGQPPRLETPLLPK